MHGGSSKITKNWQRYQVKEFEPYIPPEIVVTLNVPIESNLQPIESLERMSTWYTKVKQMYEHIAYELRYEHLSSTEYGSICMKAQNLFNHSYKVICSHWE